MKMEQNLSTLLCKHIDTYESEIKLENYLKTYLHYMHK